MSATVTGDGDRQTFLPTGLMRPSSVCCSVTVSLHDKSTLGHSSFWGTAPLGGLLGLEIFPYFVLAGKLSGGVTPHRSHQNRGTQNAHRSASVKPVFFQVLCLTEMFSGLPVVTVKVTQHH